MKTITNPTNLPLAVYNLFFYEQDFFFGGKKIDTKKINLSSGKGTIKKVKIGNFLYLEQNPHKNSENGRLTRVGNKIMWVIYEPTNTVPHHRYRPGSYLMKVQNGKSERLPASY